MLRCDDSVLCGQPTFSAMAPADRPSVSEPMSSRKISSRVCWPSAANAASACGADMAFPLRAGPIWPTTAKLPLLINLTPRVAVRQVNSTATG